MLKKKKRGCVENEMGVWNYDSSLTLDVEVELDSKVVGIGVGGGGVQSNQQYIESKWMRNINNISN